MNTSATTAGHSREEHIAHVRTIRNSADAGTLLILVGAGVSANSGLPTWHSLIDHFATELGIGKGSYSSDEYQQIPEKHYILKGHDAYHDVIQKAFDVHATPNPIHERILDLASQHIITTNYDALIEQALATRGESPYSLVRCTDEAPGNNSARFLIKMHGDLELRNYVLREKDYLDYDVNFAGVVDIIRSVLTTNLVLLVGFSSNDPNFKIIINQLRRVYGDKLKRIYLLHCSDPHTSDDLAYLAEWNIIPVYYDVLAGDVEAYYAAEGKGQAGTLVGLGRKLHDLLYYIQRYADATAMSPEIVDFLYDRLGAYTSVHSLTPELIASALQIREGGCDNIFNELIFFEEERLAGLHRLSTYSGVKALPPEDRERLRSILSILGRSWIAWVRITKGRKRHTIHPAYDQQWEAQIRRIESYDHNELDHLAHAGPSAGHPHGEVRSLLEQGYLLVVVGEYMQAFGVFGEAQQVANRGGDAWAAFVAAYNRDCISRHLFPNMFYYQGATVEEIYGMRDIVTEHPVRNRVIGVSDRRFQSLMHNVFCGKLLHQALSELKESVDEAFKQIEAVAAGGLSLFDPPLRGRAKYHFGNVWNFARRNCILMHNDSRMREAARHYIAVVLCEIKIGAYRHKDDSFDTAFAAVEWFDYDLAYFMSCSFEHGDLAALFDRIALTGISVSPEVTLTMVEAFEHLVTFGRQIDWRARLYFFEIYLANWLEIFARCTIDSLASSRVIDALSSYIEEKRISKDTAKTLAHFVESLEKRHSVVDAVLLTQVQHSIMRRILEQESEILTLDAGRRIISALTKLRLHAGAEPAADNPVDILIREVADGWRNFDSRLVSEVILHAFLPAWDVLSDEGKGSVRMFVRQVVGRDSSENALLAMFNALERGILKPDEDVARAFVIGVRELTSRAPGTSRNRYRHNHSITLLSGCLGLLIQHGIVDPDIFYDDLRAIADAAPFIALVLAPEAFDFAAFDLEWLDNMTPELAQRVCGVLDGREAVKREVHKHLALGHGTWRVVRLGFDLLSR